MFDTQRRLKAQRRYARHKKNPLSFSWQIMLDSQQQQWERSRYYQEQRQQAAGQEATVAETEQSPAAEQEAAAEQAPTAEPETAAAEQQEKASLLQRLRKTVHR